MRELLAEKVCNKNIWFHAIIGSKARSYIRCQHKYINTICLVNLEKNSIILSDHCWIIKTDEFINIPNGSNIKFSARVTTYYKKTNGGFIQDFCLTNIKNVRVVKKEDSK